MAVHIRNGFIPICIGGALEGDRSQVLVDTIEVYAEDTSSLSQNKGRTCPSTFPAGKQCWH